MSTPPIEPTKEVRFSVVMYGGVSLAIYINGVAQELFHLSRATAAVETAQNLPVAISGKAIRGSERVYRKLSYLVGDDALLESYRQYLTLLGRIWDDPQATTEDVKSFETRLRKLVDDAKGSGNKNYQDHANALIELWERARSGTDDAQKRFKELIETDGPNPCEHYLADDKPISVRFIIDVLSGTSAGGINAIYLAKAFANNQQIDQLKDLWINEGDIELLLNDKESVRGTGLLNQSPPQSLLNSRRMYSKLLRSLNDMEESNPSQENFDSPFVDELDLFITTTDIEGVPVPLRLSDNVVFERRHRNVFHFRYGKAEVVGAHFNDFRAKLNPFLAFAARCTSSFPFAFEPMRLSDINEVLNIFGGEQKEHQSDSEVWQRFFQEELDPRTGSPVKPSRSAIRSFGDGGYLDNKPFSHATDTLINRQSEVPVDRKLIYIEPSPEHPEDFPSFAQKPNALKNVKAAVLDLPTYETIREDLQRILERNQLIERVNRIISGIEKDLNNLIRSASDQEKAAWVPAIGTGPGTGPLTEPTKPSAGTGTSKSDSSVDWSKRDLAEVAQTYGRYILPYRRLRIASVTDDIAKLIARLLNFDENSDQFLAIRCIVRVWREDNFVDFRKDKPDAPTVNGFLWKYDFAYRLRRLNFIRSRIDQLTLLEPLLIKELKSYVESLKVLATERLDWDKIAETHPQVRLLKEAETLLPFLENPLPEYRDEFRDVLRFIKVELNEVFRDLRTRARLLRSRESKAADQKVVTNPLLRYITKLNITGASLNEILGTTNSGGLNDENLAKDEESCFERAKAFLRDPRGETNEMLAKVGEELAVQLGLAFESARTKCRALFDVKQTPEAISASGLAILETNRDLLKSEMATAIRGFLSYYFHNFDDYDQISFPILYETEVGEADVIEVIRVSPEDATSLIDERKELRNSPDPAKARKKLAGVALHHFGAFLDRVWRQNDIMWGRLDGAERLIDALLPGKLNEEVRKQLTREANLAILKEELRPESFRAFQSIVAESVLAAGAGTPIRVAIQKSMGRLQDVSQRRRLEKILSLSIGDDELLDFMSKGYEVNRQLDSKAMLTTISRSTQIIGNMFEQLANDNGLEGKRLRWIAQLGRLFWGLVEVAVPNTILNRLASHWLYLLYIFEVVTILGGILLSRSGAQQFGWTALAITLFTNVVVLLLKDKMRGIGQVTSVAVLLVVGLVLALVAIGALKVAGLFGFTVEAATPLTWLSLKAYELFEYAGPLKSKMAYISVLALAILVIWVLRQAGENRLGPLARWFRKNDLDHDFKNIKLKRLTKRDMVNVRLLSDNGQPVYDVIAQLSAAPPLNWINRFETKWQKLNPSTPMRVYGDIVSFNTDQTNLKSVWSDATQLVRDTNKEYAAALKEQNNEIAVIQKAQLDREEQARNNKWQDFKELN